MSEKACTGEVVTNVAMGELEVSADAGSTLTTFVGSCIALCLYDPEAKVGGMAHIMLPEGRDKDGDSGKGGTLISSSTSPNDAKYADQAVENTLRIMVRKGAKPGRMVAKMAGGAKVFAHEGSEGMFNIGQRNAEAVKALLSQKGIRLVAQDTGATTGRWVRLDVATGRVVVSRRREADKVL
jgi:chemotaxis protein CheD